MKEKKGKIFNQQEVRAIIAGNKTMFREVVKPLKHESLVDCVLKGQLLAEDSKKVKGFQVYFQKPKNKWFAEDKPTGIIVKSKFEVGQEIFVKEAFLQKLGSTQLPSGEYETFFIGSKVEYVVDGAEERWVNPDAYYSDYWKKRPAQHMKQEHSRLTLKIKSVKVERLQDISEEDAIKEGFIEQDDISNPPPIEQFANYWNSTHKKPEHKWESNPFVFVFEEKEMK